MKAMVEQIKCLPISEETARLIACIRTMQDVCNEVSDVLSSIYGEEAAESLINDKMGDSILSMDTAIKYFMTMVISGNLENISLTSI